MSFKDDYNNYYWSEKYHEDRELKHAVARGFDDSAAVQKKMSLALARKFDEGIHRINTSQMDSAGIIAESNRQASSFVGEELRHMSTALQASMRETADSMENAIARSSGQISLSIQDAANFLGLGLSKISWNIEQLTEVSRATLEVLTESLSNESRQYLEQGKICFEEEEYEMSKVLFERALESNRLNFIAYEYLGFVGIESDDPSYSRRQFELAVKFAPKGHHKAIALSHLARCLFTMGEREEAELLQAEAVQQDASQAWLWYELARYSAKLSQSDKSCKALRESVERDWKRWALSIVDEGFDPIRREVSELLAAMKKETFTRANEFVAKLEITLSKGRELEITVDTTELDSAGNLLKNDNIYDHLNACNIADKACEKLIENYKQILEERIATENYKLAELESEKQKRINTVNWETTRDQNKIEKETSEKNCKDEDEMKEAHVSMPGGFLVMILIMIIAAIWYMVPSIRVLNGPGGSLGDFLKMILTIPIGVVILLALYPIYKLIFVGGDKRLEAKIQKTKMGNEATRKNLLDDLHEKQKRLIDEIEDSISEMTIPITMRLEELIKTRDGL